MCTVHVTGFHIGCLYRSNSLKTLVFQDLECTTLNKGRTNNTLGWRREGVGDCSHPFSIPASCKLYNCVGTCTCKFCIFALSDFSCATHKHTLIYFGFVSTIAPPLTPPHPPPFLKQWPTSTTDM